MNPQDPYDRDHIAYPWTRDVATTVDAFAEFYQAALTEQSFRGEPIYHPSGQDLFRFYQAYLITKDIQDYVNAERVISVAAPAVELSVPALVVFLLYVALVGLTALWFVAFKRLPPGSYVPRTKVDWMAQGMRESLGREGDATYLGESRGRVRQELGKAEVVAVQDPLQRSYHTIQLGSQAEQRKVEGTEKA